MSYLAPAGTPVSATTYVHAVGLGLHRGGDSALAQALAQHSGHREGWLFSTGRAAMVVALQALRAISKERQRDEVIVAGYTCYSVPASVLRAGLKPRLCDIDPQTLSLNLADLRRFDPNRVLAIVSANLYGLPNALLEIERFAADAGIALLDDAAQSLGARFAGRPVGGFGDVGLYSFDKGKNITSLDGGALVASDATLAAAVRQRWQSLEGTPASRNLQSIVKLAAYSLLLRPTLYGMVQRLPLGLGQTRYEDDYPIQRYPAALSGFARLLLRRLPELMRIRAGNASALRNSLRGVSAVKPIEPLADAEPSYTRLPVLARSEQVRTQLIAQLNRHGIGATASYPAALCNVPELASHVHADDRRLAGAEDVARRIMTLPVHPFCPPGYAERIAAICSAADSL